MRRLHLLVALALCGCEAPPSSPQLARATPDEVTAATIAYLNCLAGYVSRYDDGVSDAETIAKPVSETCKPDRDGLMGVIGRDMTARQKQMLAARAPELALSYARDVVLQVRASARK